MATTKCLYCEDNTLTTLPLNSNADIARSIAMIAQGDNQKEIVICHKGEAVAISIDYCPKCGRKLS